jgi:hypothetical protein
MIGLKWVGVRHGLWIALVLAGTACCSPRQSRTLEAADLPGEYQGKAQLAAGQPELPIALSLRTDGSFVGDFPDPHLTWGGHMRAMGSWKPAGMDLKRKCLLIELAANGRRARAHCASREVDGQIGLNCSDLPGGRRCDMRKTRPAED